MTAVLERAPAHAQVDAAPRRSRWARLRVDLRLARRQVWRARGSSALVMVLVALPVAGLTGSAVFWQSHQPTAEQEAGFELGRMQSWIQIVGGSDPSRVQSADQPADYETAADDQGNPVNPQGPVPDDPFAVLPPGVTVFPVQEQGSASVRTATGIGVVTTTTGEVWDPAFEGRYHVIEGATPTGPGEAMVTPGLLDRLGTRIGGTVELTESERTFTIIGTMRRADREPASEALFLPESAEELAPGGLAFWFVADWQPDLAQLADLNRAGFVAYARDLVLHPPAGARLYPYGNDSAQAWYVLVGGAIVAVFCGYLVVLLAGAAFAVAARRQRRSLAVAASVGAARADVFRVVLLQGTVLGTIGGVAGSAAGFGFAAIALRATDRGAVHSFWGSWGFNVPWGLVAGILVFAIVVGTLAAIAPARGASRGDVLGALRGSRRPMRLHARRPLWGLGIAVLGIAMTVAGGLVLNALNAADPVDYANAARTPAFLGVVLGPVLLQIGVIIAGHWILAVVSRGLSRLGLAPRLASRDAAANPSRIVPAFAAIAACVFLASFSASVLAVNAAGSARNWQYNGPAGSFSIGIGQEGSQNSADLLAEARRIADGTEPVATAVIQSPASPVSDGQGGYLDPDFPIFAVALQPSTECPECGGPTQAMDGWVDVVAPDDVATVLGEPVDAATLDAYRAGSAIVTTPRFVTADGQVIVTEWTAATQQGFYQPTSGGDRPSRTREHPLDARLVELTHQSSFQVMLTPETARGLGMQVVPTRILVVHSAPAPQTMIDAVTDQASRATRPDGTSFWVGVESGPTVSDPWMWLIAGIALVLVVGAAAVCLGLARFERRPDDATLSAIGGSRALRRRINAWQAAIIVGLGGIVGTAAGIIPTWGIVQNSGSMRVGDFPWAVLAVLALGIPLLVAVAAWLVPPRHPDLTRRTAIA